MDDDVREVGFDGSPMRLQHSGSGDAWRFGSRAVLERLAGLEDGGWVPCSGDAELRGVGQLAVADGPAGPDQRPWWTLFGEHLGAPVDVRLDGERLDHRVLGPLWVAHWFSGFGVVTVDQRGHDRSWAYLDATGLRNFAHCPSLGAAVARRCAGRSLDDAREVAALSDFVVEEAAVGWHADVGRGDRVVVAVGVSGLVVRATAG